MKKSEALLGMLRIPVDGLAVLAALLLSYRLRAESVDLVPSVQLLEPATTLPNFDTFVANFVLPGLLTFIVIAAVLGLYAIRSTRSAWQEVSRVILCSILWLVCVIAWFFLVQKQLFYSRVLLLHAVFFLIIFVGLGRAAVQLLQRSLLRHGIGVRQVVSIGSHPIAQVASDRLQSDMHYNYRGHMDDLSQLEALQSTGQLDLVLQTDPSPTSEQTIALIDYCRSHHVGYGFLPPVLADVPHLLSVERLGLLPLMRLHPTPLDGWGRIFKRVFDLVVGLALLVVLSPVLLAIACVILITSGRPIFYVSWRIGERADGKIPIIKFRSMVRDADKRKQELQHQNERNDGPLFKIKDDPRITPIGQFLRRFDLDELPQLINVLFGTMSLVGPRPHLPEEVDRYSQYQRRVFAVKPGLTGLAQVSGRSGLRFDEEVHLDLQYIEEWSLFLDLWILWRTVWVVLRGTGE